jgi:hypothetical protein
VQFIKTFQLHDLLDTLVSLFVAIVLGERLKAANYPIRETKVVYRSDDHVEVAAELVALAAEPDELDPVVAGLRHLARQRAGIADRASLTAAPLLADADQGRV